MRDWSQGARLAMAILATAGAVSTAHASNDDIVVMPYRCAVVDGKPVLTPSYEEQGHRVLGALEEQKVKTCSTVDRKRCKQWATFKFDMDCGGARVSWLSVFANAFEQSRRRVWEHNGQLRVRDTPTRSDRVYSTCARRLGSNLELSSTSQLCDEVSTVDAPTSTDMPPGFAPMVGLDATLLPAEALESPSARRDSTAIKAAPRRVETATAKVATQKASAASAEHTREQQAAATRPAASPVSETSSLSAAGQPDRKLVAVSPAKPTVPVAAPRPVIPETQTTPAPATSQPLVAAESRPIEVAQASAAPQQLAVAAAPSPTASAKALEPQASRSTAAAIPEPRESVVPQAKSNEAPIRTHETRDAGQSTPVSTSSRPIVETQASAAPLHDESVYPAVAAAADPDRNLAYEIAMLAGGLLLVTVAAVSWLGGAKRSVKDIDQRVEPIIAAESADTATVAEAVVSDPELTGSGKSVAVLSRPVSSAPARTAGNSALGSLRALGDKIPNSKREALEVLGMGIANEGNLASLKKIIDGLRMNWHPDHASDEADRQVREVRLKQINAAWEILGGKAAGA